MTISVNIYKLHAQIKNVKADMSVLDINSLDWHRNFGKLSSLMSIREYYSDQIPKCLRELADI